MPGKSTRVTLDPDPDGPPSPAPEAESRAPAAGPGAAVASPAPPESHECASRKQSPRSTTGPAPRRALKGEKGGGGGAGARVHVEPSLSQCTVSHAGASA